MLAPFWSAWVASWPTWEWIRTLGMTAYFLLFIGTATGLLQSLPVLTGKVKGTVVAVHTFSLNLGFWLSVAHACLLSVDRYMPFAWREIFLPFAAVNETFLNALGTLALYMWFVILLSSDMLQRLGKKTWKRIHWLAYPLFVFATLHGILLGTESSTLWGAVFYSFAAGIILVLTLLRVTVPKGGRRADAHTPRRRRPETGFTHPAQAGKREP